MTQQTKKKKKDPIIMVDGDFASELKQFSKKALITELMSDKVLLISGNKNDSGDEGGGSDSDPSEDNMDEEDMAKIIPIKVCKKKKQDPKKQLSVKK